MEWIKHHGMSDVPTCPQEQNDTSRNWLVTQPEHLEPHHQHDALEAASSVTTYHEDTPLYF